MKIRVVGGLALFLSLACTGVATAQGLKPFQSAALERLLAEVEPDARALARSQLEPMLALMDEAQVRMMLGALEQPAQQSVQPAESPPVATPAAAATADDLAFNRAQYEPAIRRLWQAQRTFDDFVTALLVQHCPPRGTYAVFGSAWRHEVDPPDPRWGAASDSADLDVQVLGPAYAPQDRRYQFDFSGVRTEFDRAAVETAVRRACGEYAAAGEAFVAEARPLAQQNQLDAIARLEARARTRVAPHYQALEQALAVASPGGDYALFNALQNPVPARR